MLKLDGEYNKNNTTFCKPDKFHQNEIIKQNIVFLESDNLKENIEALLKESGINTIRITSLDYKLDNLDFLKKYDLSFIESIDILSDSVKNIDGLYSLKNLKHINSENLKIDYSKFENLVSIFGELHNSSYNSVSELINLKQIRLSKFKKDNLEIFSKNTNLIDLMLTQSKIKSLKGLDKLIHLKFIELNYCSKLESLKGLNKNHINIEEIILYSTPKLYQVNDFLSEIIELKKLQLNSKKVDSFKFLDSMKKLELLGIHNLICNVENGDKKPLIRALKRTNGKIWN